MLVWYEMHWQQRALHGTNVLPSFSDPAGFGARLKLSEVARVGRKTTLV